MKAGNILALLILALSVQAQGRTVIFEENFDGDYTASFPYMYDGDKLEPNSAISAFFYSGAAGSYMPWWIVKDSNDSKDRFIASHSYYDEPGKSSDWLISVPIEIPTKGFVLTFGAQSLPWRNADNLSDLSLFITDDIVDPKNLPTEPTIVWEKIPYGKDRYNCENDWTYYTLPLDEYAGRTIYLNFANLNEDNDILCIDHVSISREDAAEVILADYDAFTESETLDLEVTVKALAADGLRNWKVELIARGAGVASFSGEMLASGDTATETLSLPLTKGESHDFKVELTADNSFGYSVAGNVTRLAYTPVHRLFMEETTSLHCGNCPMGMYTMESLLSDQELGDKEIPVNVHITSMGYDPMVCDDYSRSLNATAAPLVFIERNPEYDGFVPACDGDFDTENPNSFAWRTARRIEQGTVIGVEVEGTWQIQGADTTAIQCKARVVPAIDLRDVDYRVAFILTENNVGLDGNPYWLQSNYLSGADNESRWGGWADLPPLVANARYHDVARAISSFEGHARSLPGEMKAMEEYTYEFRLPIPDTYYIHDGVLQADAIQRQFCQLTAIVIDNESGRVLNAARVPMSDNANNRFTAEDLVKASISDAVVDSPEGEYKIFDLTGRRITNPTAGIYILSAPSGTTKALIR